MSRSLRGSAWAGLRRVEQDVRRSEAEGLEMAAQMAAEVVERAADEAGGG